MNDVLICGYYGMDNIGDEAILESIINHLRKNDKGISLSVLSGQPDKTSKQFNVLSFDRWNEEKIINCVDNSKVICIGGGSLLQDITDTITVRYYLGILSYALKKNKKSIIYSQGLGPITKEHSKILISKVLPQASAIFFRDIDSAQLYKELTNQTNYNIVCDPVFSLKPTNSEKTKSIIKTIIDKSGGKPIIGISLKDGFGNEKDWLKLLVDIETQYNAFFLFIPFHQRFDVHITTLITEQLPFNNWYILYEELLPSEYLSIIELSNLFIGVRYHSLIFAYNASVPFIGLNYDPKIKGLINVIKEPICIVEKVNNIFENISTVFDYHRKYISISQNNKLKLGELSEIPAIEISKMVK